MTTLVSSSNASLPKISYLKSVDVFLVTCFVMVFASLLEFACVSYLGNRRRKPKARNRLVVGRYDVRAIEAMGQLHAMEEGGGEGEEEGG